MIDTFTVVGVVGNVKESRLNDQAEPVVYLSYLQNATRYAHVLVRTRSTPTNITSIVQREIRAVDPDLGVYDTQSMDTILDQAVAAPRLNSVLLWLFAGMALVLSAIGIYGVTSYAKRVSCCLLLQSGCEGLTQACQVADKPMPRAATLSNKGSNPHRET